MKILKKSLSFLLLIPFFTSCIYDIRIVGNNDYVEEGREIPDFDELSVSGNYHVFFSYARTPKVYVYGESNLLPYVETAVFSNQLRIKTASGVDIAEHETIEVYVEGPNLRDIRLSGSGYISSEDVLYEESLDISVSGSGEVFAIFEGDELDASVSGSGFLDIDANCDESDFRVSGSGSIRAEGQSEDCEYRVSGSGMISAYEFQTQYCEADISGSGEMYINVVRYLEANVSGSGCIFYIGHPTISARQSGSGLIIDSNY